jgi:hypothetical protein
MSWYRIKLLLVQRFEALSVLGNVVVLLLYVTLVIEGSQFTVFNKGNNSWRWKNRILFFMPDSARINSTKSSFFPPSL